MPVDAAAAADPPARGTRPANRRDLIVAAATELFYRHGYDKVGMNDIADAVSISRPALYRHFSGKQDLLAAVLTEAIGRTAAALASADAEDLDAVLRAIASDVLDHRAAGVLWQRDGRHLAPDARAALREKTKEIGQTITRLLRERRPELDAAAAGLITWCALAAATSVSFHSLDLPRAEFEPFLADLVGRVVQAPVPAARDRAAPAPGGRGLASQSRWETLLGTATRLFAVRGYGEVGMDDIAAEVGIAGPSVYNHFASKAELLVTAMNRAADWLRYDLDRALRSARDAADGLRRLVASYPAFVLEHSHLVDLLVNETEHLPDEARAHMRRTVRDYIGDWAHLLRTVHEGLDETRARMAVWAVLSMANNVARSPRLRRGAGAAEMVAALGAAALGLPPED